MPPEPPDLGPSQIEHIVEFASQMAYFWEAELADIKARGLSPHEQVSRNVDGWNFTHLALREAYGLGDPNGS